MRGNEKSERETLRENELPLQMLINPGGRPD